MNLESDNRANWLAPVGTVFAVLACYGTLAAVGMLSLMGVAIAVNERIWAGAIVVFAMLALTGLVLSWRSHRALPPLLLGIVGAGLIVFTMTVFYSQPMEIAGFAMLILAAFLDWRAKRTVRRE
jgi:MerC mercury resistance protein